MQFAPTVYLSTAMGYHPDYHHRRSVRLKGYDYAQEGAYFITICCENHVCRFGTVQNGFMVLNSFGQIAHEEWLKTAQIRPQIELDDFIIMPNHMHAVFFIRRGELHSPYNTGGFPQEGELHSPLQVPFRSPAQTVGAVVRGYKSAVAGRLKEVGFTEKLWQRSFWEHIIRDEPAYQNITGYVRNNPRNWQRDKFYFVG